MFDALAVFSNTFFGNFTNEYNKTDLCYDFEIFLFVSTLLSIGADRGIK